MSAACMRLVQSLKHSPPSEYRVTEDGRIEARVPERGSDWTELSSAQVSSHVMRNTVVARWLEQNLGWRRLLWACVGESLHAQM
jgi:hypothetical protein